MRAAEQTVPPRPFLPESHLFADLQFGPIAPAKILIFVPNFTNFPSSYKERNPEGSSHVKHVK
jgi:hypothetical protein